MKLEPITRANRPPRKEVLLGEQEAAALIKDGDTVIVGGFGTVNHPMPIIRALIRRGVKNLTVIGAATAGLEIDMMIGAGCVKKVIAPYIGAELHAPIGIRLAQALHHGTDHRSQICTGLTRMGIEPPEIDVWAFAEQDGRLAEVFPAS